MHHIEPYTLWIGHAGDCRDPRSICDHEIAAVLQLATEEAIPLLPREVLLFRIPILDGSGNSPDRLELAIDLLVRLLASQVTTLVCCSAGASRSPAVAACALAKLKGGPPLDYLRLIRQAHPTDVSPGLWNDLLQVLTRSLR